MKWESKAVRTDIDASQYREHSPALHLSSSFTFESAEQMAAVFAKSEEGFIYSRFDNPTVRAFELKMAALEGTEDAFATASGMAANFAALLTFLKAGDHIIAVRDLFGSSYGLITNWLPRWGISCTLVDITDAESWEKHVQPNTVLFFAETPTNPGLKILDLKKAAAFCNKHDLKLIIDNCFATPYIQRPAAFGADLVLHSATKFIDGQGRVVGGVVCGSTEIITDIKAFCRTTGPSMAPFNAWVLLKSLETLHVRMDRHCANAALLAEHLLSVDGLSAVSYPGLSSHPQHDLAMSQMKNGGAMVTFKIENGLAGGQKFLNKLNMISRTANLGDARTIASHPASTTHHKLTPEQRAELGISDGMIRISVGLEHIDDIIADITQALDHT